MLVSDDPGIAFPSDFLIDLFYISTCIYFFLSFCSNLYRVTFLIYLCVGAHRWGRRNALGKEAVAKIIDDTYRYNFSVFYLYDHPFK